MISVRIQCACGQPYAFKVEPIAGRMPSTVACPVCGADGTTAANKRIAQFSVAPAAVVQASAKQMAGSTPKGKTLSAALSAIVVLMACAAAGLLLLRNHPRTNPKANATPAAIDPQVSPMPSVQAEDENMSDARSEIAAEPGIVAQNDPGTRSPASTTLGSGKQPASPTRNAVEQPISVKHNFAAWPAFVADHLRGSNMVGGYCFVVRVNGQIVSSGTGGYARMPWEKQDPGVRWSLTTPMEVASVSKLITAISIMKLWEEKHYSFSFDEPFWPYAKTTFPEVHEDIRHITIRQLLTHHSGFTDSPENRQKIAQMLTQPTPIPSGTKFHYANVNFFLARLVLETISGEPYTQYVRNHVLIPAGATRMDTRIEKSHAVLGYDSQRVGLPGAVFAGDNGEHAGAHGWYASATDLTSLLYAATTGRILSRDTFSKMSHEGLGCYPMKAQGLLVGYGHGGTWSLNNGHCHSEVIHFVDGVDAALLANYDQQRVNGRQALRSVLIEAWQLQEP